MTKIYLTLGVIFITISFCKAQSLEGFILDHNTKEPVVNANVYLKSTQIGSSTNHKGKFQIDPFLQKFQGKNLIVSRVGYQTIEVLPDSFNARETDTFYLKEKSLNLREIEITDSFKLKKTGYLGYSKKEKTRNFIDLRNTQGMRIQNDRGAIYISEISLFYGYCNENKDTTRLRIGFHTLAKHSYKPDQMICKRTVNLLNRKGKSQWASFEFEKAVKIPFEEFIITFDRTDLSRTCSLGNKFNNIPEELSNKIIYDKQFDEKWGTTDGPFLIRLTINEPAN